MSDSTRETILSEVSSIVGETLVAPNLQLTEESTASDIAGWDSLTHVQIIVAIERKYDVRFSSTEVSQLENTGSLVDLIIKHQ